MRSSKFLMLLTGLVIFTSLKKPVPEPGNTNWVSLQDAAQQFEKEKRPILIDLYTDWCGWCKVMDKKTYSNRNVSKYLSEKFYTVKFNAEGKQRISWKGRTFDFNPRYKAHDFAIYLTNGQLSFPTTVIIPPDGSEPQAIPGFLDPKDFELIAKYFGEGQYGKVTFDQYQRSFKSTW